MEYVKKFEDSLKIYLERKELFAKGCIDGKSLFFAKEDACSGFLNMVDNMIHEKYRNLFRLMKLNTDYHFGKIFISPAYLRGKTSISVLYTPNNYSLEDDCIPLVSFYFVLNNEKLSVEYAEELFKRIDEQLEEILYDTFMEWSQATSEYYALLHNHSVDFFENDFEFPLANLPEACLSMNKTIILD